MKLLQPVDSEREREREGETKSKTEKERWGYVMSFDPVRNALLLFYSACVCMCVVHCVEA